MVIDGGCGWRWTLRTWIECIIYAHILIQLLCNVLVRKKIAMLYQWSNDKNAMDSEVSPSRLNCGCIAIKVHQPGIEPGSHRWQRCILPLDQWCCWIVFGLASPCNLALPEFAKRVFPMFCWKLKITRVPINALEEKVPAVNGLSPISCESNAFDHLVS
jgi:hypothetical protein